MQKLVAALAVFVVAFVTPAFAQSADEAAVGRAMDALSKAITTVDKAQLENLAWPELTYGHSAGRIENKAQYVDAIVSKKSIVTKVDLSNVTTSIVGDIALVRGKMFLMVESTGKPVPTDLAFLMVWQKRAGEWKLLARQAYKV
jgi:uncharacterized membrane protein YvbJ